ncbi:hypothetical protein KM914_16055 [Virgibacillus pantothenticus]|uniref:hypothetical protein n=1 Tax=Virgibacillus pantothenticus TaxID=1473 RepID=UPI001C222093|nr:hypothetical protein [Virgibacillus pantothenticus]MBU8567916.1 hypothetical protein [Virgibacillus pantothenticus]MBU8601824.1 hypothetical protein [Virgibacillus pantothenticus]MBU8635978.1 hypothetical protein [Virgibacillus pantothenticus]MBU8643662.1 hypothetical protein [Virgibacillus pantothenticus]MBU8647802.1 hypothetical protein [Virgibacillus pantothenticus]
MTNEELIIVPVTLHPEKEESTLAIPPNSSVDPVCTMKSTNLEISFFNGVDEHIIQTVIKELKNG